MSDKTEIFIKNNKTIMTKNSKKMTKMSKLKF